MSLFSGVALLIIALIFSILNKGAVALDLWPFDRAVEVRVFVIALVPLFIGFCLGFFIGWLKTVPYKSQIRTFNKELKDINEKISDLRN
ncbi:MAG: LapA family protein [Alphaproteobacteria bacterium]|nr:LapA family protein [Alphaproteobacteria bacterium]